MAYKKQVNKPICKNSLDRAGHFVLCTLEAQEVTTNGVYRLLYATVDSPCLRDLTSMETTAQSINFSGIVHAQFAEGLHFY